MAVIPTERWRQRLKSALELQGKELKDLPSEIEGFPKDAARRAGHESDDFTATTPLARAVAEEIGFPEEWFTSDDFGVWISQAARALREEPEARRLTVAEFREALEAQALLRRAEQAAENCAPQVGGECVIEPRRM